MPEAPLQIDKMRAGADRATALLKALGHGERLLLLCQLSQGEMCVSELEAALDIHQPNLSQQLGKLRESGLITPRREGKHIYYRVSDPSALTLLQTLYKEFCPD